MRSSKVGQFGGLALRFKVLIHMLPYFENVSICLFTTAI